MPAYNFQKRFAPLVQSGQKRQTIRALGKRRHARPGEPLQLYTGQRSKACRKLISPDPVCLSTAKIEMTVERGFFEAFLDGRLLNTEDLAGIARADGFDDVPHMVGWFVQTHGLPFEGILIKW